MPTTKDTKDTPMKYTTIPNKTLLSSNTITQPTHIIIKPKIHKNMKNQLNCWELMFLVNKPL